MAMNFKDALNTKMSDVEKPPILPQGTYKGTVKKLPTTEETEAYDFLDFPIQFTEAQEDVSTEDLATYGGLGPLSVNRYRFLFNKEDDVAFKRTLWDVKQFCFNSLGIADEGQELKTLLQQSVGQQALFFVKHTQDKRDNTIIHANISKAAPL